VANYDRIGIGFSWVMDEMKINQVSSRELACGFFISSSTIYQTFQYPASHELPRGEHPKHHDAPTKEKLM
jgi:lactam utilization protein B